MPHDRDGRPLMEGDAVMIHGTIKQIHPNPDYCNVLVETDLPMYPGEDKVGISLNARQVVKAASEPEISEPKAN